MQGKGHHLFYPLQRPDNDADDDDVTRNERGSEYENIGASPFVHPRRANRDLWWWWALVGCCAGVFIAAAVLQYRNRDAGEYISEEAFLNDPANCPAQPSTPARKALFSTVRPFSLKKMYWHDIKYLPGGILLGVVVLRLFEWKPQGTVRLVASMQLAVPLCAAAYMLTAARISSAALLLMLGIINLVCLGIWRAKLPLLGRLISIACSVISDNPNLFWVSVFFQVIVTIVMASFDYASFVIGDVRVLKPARLADGPDPDSATCLHTFTQQPTPCCEWQGPEVVLLLLSYATFVLRVWMVAFIVQAQAFVVSGTVCQWYFAPPSATCFRGNTLRSGKHLTRSLGTIAVGSLALDWVRFLRRFTYVNDRRLHWKNPLAYICGILFCPLFCLSCCTNQCLDGITKYATHRAAISGYSFRDSNSVMRHTLRRQQMNHIGIGWLPPLILGFSSTTLATTIGLLKSSPFSSKVKFETDELLGTSLARDVFQNFSMSKANICYITMFLAGPLLLAIIDSLYVCFALDLEQRTCTKKAVHDVFTHRHRIGPIWDDAPCTDAYTTPLMASVTAEVAQATVLQHPALSLPAGSVDQQQG